MFKKNNIKKIKYQITCQIALPKNLNFGFEYSIVYHESHNELKSRRFTSQRKRTVWNLIISLKNLFILFYFCFLCKIIKRQAKRDFFK